MREVKVVRGSVRCLIFYQGVDSKKNLQTPVDTVCACALWTSCLVQTL